MAQNGKANIRNLPKSRKINLPIILASSSPRRIEILKKFDIQFNVKQSNYEETHITNVKEISEVKKLVISNAKGKALSVAKSLNEGIIIGVDTLVVTETKVLGKPHSVQEAYRMLTLLSNSVHKIISGIVVVKKDNGFVKVVTNADIVKVYFKKLTKQEIHNYIATGEPFDKAGSYAIQEKGGLLIKKIDGEYNSAVGLPIHSLLKLCKKLGLDIF